MRTLSHRLLGRFWLQFSTATILVCAIQMLPAFAQSELATVFGRITDPSGAVIAGAEVEVKNVETNVSSIRTTNEDGLYSIPSLHPGHYLINVHRQGFKTVTLTELDLNVQDNIARNFVLQVGSVSESVTVTADQGKINTTDASVSTVVDRQFVENMPLNGRSFHSLLELTPGVVLTGTEEQGEQGQFAINGNRADSNFFSIDGVSANFAITPVTEPGADAGGALPALSALGGTSNLVSVDALQEFRLETSGFAPELGRGGAQVLLVTRSGTNQFHGALFDYLRNDIFDANNWFADAKGLPKPPIRQNDFGGVFGGPIVKDKTFFFFSYEGLRLRLPKVAITDVPSLFARANAVPAVRPYLNAYSLPNGPAVVTDKNGNVLANEFDASYSDPASLDAYSLRIDQRIGSNWTLFGRANYSPSSSSARNSGGANPVVQVTTTEKSTQTNTVGLTGVFSPHLVEDFRFNYSTDTGSVLYKNDTFGGGTPLANSIAFPPGYGSVNDSNGGVFIRNLLGGQYLVGVNAHDNRQHQLEFTDSVSLAQGTHEWKMGFDFRRLRPELHPRQFDLLPVFNTMQDALTGVANRWTVQNNTNTAQLLYHNYSAYLQDEWHSSGQLTLTYGVRWERNPPPSELTGHPLFAVDQIANLATMKVQPSGTPAWDVGVGSFAPRFGASYLLRQSSEWATVVRGGFGMFYSLGTETTGDAAHGSQNPYGTSLRVNNLSVATPPPVPAARTTLTTPYTDVVLFDPHLKTPYTEEWNFTIEQELHTNQRVTVSYIGSIGRNLLRQNALSSMFLPVNPIFTAIYLTDNSDYSNYNSLQAQYQRRLSRGLQLLASYDFSHSLDNGSGNSIFGPNFDNSNQLPSAFYNVKQDYGPSAFDIRHTLSFAATYSFPGQGLGGITRKLFGGWSLDGIVRARSAPPLTVIYLPNLSPFFDNQAGQSVYFRPNVVSGQPFFIADAAVPGGRRINPAAFSTPTFASVQSAAQGTLGRNALRGFGATQADVSLRREMFLREHLKLILRLDAFNVFNHPNFGSPQNNMTIAGFGEPTSTLAQSLGTGSGFGGGFNPLYAIGGPRSMQVSVKVQF
jgi:carboxypeptidase family protein